MELSCMGACPASTTAVVVPFAPASVVPTSASASVVTATTVVVVSTPAASPPAAPSASTRSSLHCCQLGRTLQHVTLDSVTLNCVPRETNRFERFRVTLRESISCGSHSISTHMKNVIYFKFYL